MRIARCGGIEGVLAEEGWRSGDGVVRQWRRKEPGVPRSYVSALSEVRYE